MQLSHRKAMAVMVGVTLMWSIAGVVTRQLEAARAFEITFWRSAFNALALVALLSWLRGPGRLWRSLRSGGRALWGSGLCWCVMFTAFMVAITLTTVANVLITMSLAPLFTALASRAVLGHRVAPRTWAAIVVAGIGIAWMYAREVSGAGAQHLVGTLIALAVPVAGAANWTLMQHLHHAHARLSAGSGPSLSTAPEPAHDMLPAVLIGAVLSALIAFPLAIPFSASTHDLGWLALLGVVQLAIPCLIATALTRVLKAPEIALMALLEVVFGVAWAWLGAGEQPSLPVIGGGALVLLALAANEAAGLRRAPA
jgi:drug/metabolite transporter (DMT)-like permease